MHSISSDFEIDLARRSLVRELGSVDARQLLDMGLVRGLDGALYLAEDPARQVAPAPLQRHFQAILAAVARRLRMLFGLRNVSLHEALRRH